MNTFGRLFRISIYGESHGKGLGILIDGCPPGIPLSEYDFSTDLERRRGGKKGATSRAETDIPIFVSGLFNGKTTGAPVLIHFENKDTDSSAYEEMRYTPRPGHADFVAFQKYHGFNDYRGGGHFSGRLTLGLTAAGVIAKKIISPVAVEANLVEAGGLPDIDLAVEKAISRNNSIGGIVTCTATGLPVGLGEPFFDSVESLISHAVFSIPAIKGIEFGAGFALGAMYGSESNDIIIDSTGRTKTNNAGGITGGITSGNDLFFRVAIKPTPSIPLPQKTVDIRTGKQTDITIKGRHDVCIALRVPVVVEAVTAIVLADLLNIENANRRDIL